MDNRNDKSAQETQQPKSSESKGKRIARLIITWIVVLAFATFLIMLVIRKCSGG